MLNEIKNINKKTALNYLIEYEWKKLFKRTIFCLETYGNWFRGNGNFGLSEECLKMSFETIHKCRIQFEGKGMVKKSLKITKLEYDCWTLTAYYLKR